MRSSRMTTVTIYRPATTEQHLQGALEGYSTFLKMFYKIRVYLLGAKRAKRPNGRFPDSNRGRLYADPYGSNELTPERGIVPLD